MTSLFLNKLDPNNRTVLLSKLLEAQSGRCFICEKEIAMPLQAETVDIDHVVPISTGGKDDETNFAVTHASCNRSKQASDLRIARVLARFNRIQDESVQSNNRGANLSDVLAAYGGASAELPFTIEDGKVRFSLDKSGDPTVHSAPLYKDPLSGMQYFFAELPIAYLHHDDRINPRNIGPNLGKLLAEFHKGRPQLHVALGWTASKNGPAQIKVFDGQHKATAQVLLGNKNLPIRVFVNPDPDVLLETNTNAGTSLRQVAFDRSVQRRLGRSLFGERLERYRQDLNLSEDDLNFSETAIYGHFKGESREIKRYIIDNQRAQITDHPDNRLREFMDYAGKKAEKPLSYNTIERTFYSFFIFPQLLETPLNEGEDTGTNPRELEIEQIVKLMNIVAEEIFEDRFDAVLGTSRIENKIQKGEDVPDNHLRAFRMGKEEVLYSWLRYVRQIVIQHFVASGMPHEEDRLFQYQFSEVLWDQIRAYIRNLAAMPVWINHDLSVTVFGGRQTNDFWRTIWEKGATPEGTRVLAKPLNLVELSKIQVVTAT